MTHGASIREQTNRERAKAEQTRASTRRVLIPPGLPLGLLKDYPRGAVVRSLGGETMGTTWSVSVAMPAKQPLSEIRQGLQAELDLVVSQMSTWLPDSDISRFNRAPARSWQRVPEELFEVLSCALTVARDSGGAYDPTVGALVDLWGFGPQGPRKQLPSPADLDSLCRAGGWQTIALDPAARAVLQSGSARLDFSGIAKGYAVDRLARLLESLGFAHYLVEVGGELRGSGCKPGCAPWWVALEWPAFTAQELAHTVVALHGIAVATSGDYRRYFETEGRRYPHTIDPRTGYPINHPLASVTVLHSSCMYADAWATALTVLGLEAGMRHASEHDLAALFVVRTPTGFAEHLTPTLACFLDE